MQEISINLPIIFQILFLQAALTWEDKMRLNIENNYVFVRIIKLAIMFAGIVKYFLQVAMGGVETFSESIKVKNIFQEKPVKDFLSHRLQFLINLPE